jgi:hypothetical protein
MGVAGMAEAATTAAPATRTSRLERFASGLTIISAAVLAGYLLYRLGIVPLDTHVTWQAAAGALAPVVATLIGGVGSLSAWLGRRRTRALREKDERSTRSKVAQGLIAAPAALQNLPDWLSWMRASHFVSNLFTGGVLVGAVAVTVVTGAPRAPLIGFAGQLVINCQLPLQSVYQHASEIHDAASSDSADPAAFRSALERSTSDLQADATNLTKALGALGTVRAPQAAYQGLLADCTSAVRQARDFLNTENIAAGAPINAQVSGVSLVRLAAAQMTTNPDQVGPVASDVFRVFDDEFNQTADLRARLGTEAGQLQNALLTP